MADISVRRKHGMDFDEAKDLTLKIVDNVKAEFPALVDQIKWNGDKTSADVKGKGFKGKFAVDASTVTIDISLSLFAKPFKSKVEGKITNKLNEYFGS